MKKLLLILWCLLPLSAHAAQAQKPVSIKEFLRSTVRMLNALTNEKSPTVQTQPLRTQMIHLLVDVLLVTCEIAKRANLPGSAPIAKVMSHVASAHKATFAQQLTRCKECEIEDAKQEQILGTLAVMMGNIASIIAQPKNPAVVGTNVAQICACIIAMARTGKRSTRVVDAAERKAFQRDLVGLFIYKS